jgi:hypothetical protein
MCLRCYVCGKSVYQYNCDQWPSDLMSRVTRKRAFACAACIKNYGLQKPQKLL